MEDTDSEEREIEDLKAEIDEVEKTQTSESNISQKPTSEQKSDLEQLNAEFDIVDIEDLEEYD